MGYRRDTAKAPFEPIKDTRQLVDQLAMEAKAEAQRQRLYTSSSQYNDSPDLRPATRLSTLPRSVQTAVNMYTEGHRAIVAAGFDPPSIGACDIGEVYLKPKEDVPALVASRDLYNQRRHAIEAARLTCQTAVTGRHGDALRTVLEKARKTFAGILKAPLQKPRK